MKRRQSPLFLCLPSILATIGNRLRNMRFVDSLCSRQIGDGTGQLEQLVITAGTQAKFFDSVYQGLLKFPVQTTDFVQVFVPKAGVNAALARELKPASAADSLSNFAAGLRRFLLLDNQLLVFESTQFDLDVDTIEQRCRQLVSIPIQLLR